MAAISKIQGVHTPALSGQVAETTRPQPENPAPPSGRSLPVPPSPKGVDQAMKDQDQTQTARDHLDPEKMQALVEKLQKHLDEASAEPHEVGFRQDPRTESYVIEIKDPEGQVIKQFPPEKVLNLQQKLDELSGMVIDRMT
jgi:uncharacterized FlaG/YvyC family protein